MNILHDKLQCLLCDYIEANQLTVWKDAHGSIPSKQGYTNIITQAIANVRSHQTFIHYVVLKDVVQFSFTDYETHYMRYMCALPHQTVLGILFLPFEEKRYAKYEDFIKHYVVPHILLQTKEGVTPKTAQQMADDKQYIWCASVTCDAGAGCIVITQHCGFKLLFISVYAADSLAEMCTCLLELFTLKNTPCQ